MYFVYQRSENAMMSSETHSSSNERIIALPPVLPSKPQVLILGSVPSEISIKVQQYYGNPRNHFWRIMFHLFGKGDVPYSYAEKLKLLHRHHIALWDSIASCKRKGSLDHTITEEIPNAIPELLKKHPTIRVVGCNGTKSHQVFRKTFGKMDLGEVQVIKLPSTSPIPGRYTKNFEGKLEAWQVILGYLDEVVED